MKKVILIPGLIGGGITAIVLICSTIYWYQTNRFENSMLLGYASMILAFSMIYVAVKNLRDKYYNGVISFGKAFRAGLMVTLITSTVYVITWLICYYFFIPDFMERYTEYMQQKAAAQGTAQEEIAKMQQYTSMYKNPLMVILLTYMEIFPVGLVISVITALILKRKK